MAQGVCQSKVDLISSEYTGTSLNYIKMQREQPVLIQHNKNSLNARKDWGVLNENRRLLCLLIQF